MLSIRHLRKWRKKSAANKQLPTAESCFLRINYKIQPIYLDSITNHRMQINHC